LAIRHADTLICFQWDVSVLTLRLSVYTLGYLRKAIKHLGKNFCITKSRHSLTPRGGSSQ